MGYLTRHPGGGGALPGGICEYMPAREIHFPDKGKRLGKFFFGLAGKSCNDIRRDGDVRDDLSSCFYEISKGLRSRLPRHAAEGGTRTGLERQVDLVIDAGACDVQPTTVIDLTGDAPEMVRLGKGDPARFGL